ncbi:MAG: sulfite exporter TauE/SafE family protein [Acidobacteriota bacterium]
MTLPLPDLAPWRWALGAFCAFMIGIAKTGAPGVGTLVAPLMVMVVGDARLSTAWALPILVTADVFAVWYWRRQSEIQSLFSLIPWVLVGIVGGAFALGLSEIIIRRMIGVIVIVMLVLYLRRRLWPSTDVQGNPAFYGVATGFSSTVANAAGPVMSLYLLSRKLPKEQFVATGAWFFLLLNLAKSPIYAWHGLYSAQSLTFDFVLIPVVLCGALTGRWLVRVMPQKLFETLVIGLTAVSCLLLFR